VTEARTRRASHGLHGLVHGLDGTLYVSELFVGPISSTQPNRSQSEDFGPTNQPNPQPSRTPHNQHQTFAHKDDNLGALFHKNVMTVRTGDAPSCRFTKRTV